METKAFLLEEIHIMVKHANYDYHSVNEMPTYERRFFISKLIEENEKVKNEMKKYKK